MSVRTSMLVLAGIIALHGAATGEEFALHRAASAGRERGELTGKLLARRARQVTIVPDPGASAPAAGARATLSKHFVKNLGFLKTQGWLEIAVVNVKETGRRIVLTIVEEKSKMKVNGKPVDHFKPGVKVKLVWGG